MGFEGTLEDLAVADVLQLLHISKKSGTLVVQSADKSAKIFLQDGDITGARHPQPGFQIGRVLLQLELLDGSMIDEALCRQAAAGDDRRPLLAMLIEMGCLAEKDAWRALERLIELTLIEILGWREGRFCFESREMTCNDDFRHFPCGVVQEFSLDTQHLLIDAFRILDERNRNVSPEPAPEAASPPPSNVSFELGAGSQAEASGPEALQDRRVVCLCRDELMAQALPKMAEQAGFELFVTRSESEAFQMTSGLLLQGAQAVTVVDCGEGESLSAEVEGLLWLILQVCPEVPLLALCPASPEVIRRAYELGAMAVLLRQKSEGDPVQALHTYLRLFNACLEGMFRRRESVAQTAAEGRRLVGLLRQRMLELRGHEEPSEVALLVLEHVAQFLERCVIFLVRGEEIQGLGAFGLDRGGETISTAVVRLRISLKEPSRLRDVVRSGQVFYGPADDPKLAKHLYAQIGSPLSPEMVLVPLWADERTVALIYGDFGAKPARPIFTDALDIIACQAGLVLEIGTLRKQLARIVDSGAGSGTPNKPGR